MASYHSIQKRKLTTMASFQSAVSDKEFGKIFGKTYIGTFVRIAVNQLGIDINEIDQLKHQKDEFEAKMAVCLNWYNKNSSGSVEEIRQKLHDCLSAAADDGLISHERFDFLIHKSERKKSGKWVLTEFCF